MGTTLTRRDSPSSGGGYRAEEQLLIECVRRHLMTSDLAAVTRLVSGPLDWPYLLRIATWHQLLPLLHRALVESEAAGVSVPSAVGASVREQLDTRTARNRRLADELVRLLRLASDTGLALLPFKGPVLAVAVYGDLALRQFADLDLLVEPAQSEAAEALLARLGYELRSDFGWAAHLAHRETGLCVDLHRGQITPASFPVPIAVSRLWARRQRVWLGDAPVDTLSMEDLLVVLCIQIARDALHGKTRLNKICDLAHALKAGPRLRWSHVEAEAGILRVKNMLEFGIRLAERITQVPRPSPRRAAPPRGIVGLVEQEERALFDDPAAPPASRVRGRLAHVHLRERWRDKLLPYRRDALALLSPTSRDRAAVRLPPGLSWLYYLIRPFLICGRYGRYLINGRAE